MEEKKTMMIPTEKQFNLSKVKILNDGSIKVDYEISDVDGSDPFVNNYTVESSKTVHPDLLNVIKRMIPVLGRTFNITSFLSMVESEQFKSTSEQQKVARMFAEEVLKNIEVKGVSLSGSGENLGCVLTGMFTTINGQKSCINTPKIRFNTDSFGFEEELNDLVAELEEEVYAYLFKGKQAQLEIFGAENE